MRAIKAAAFALLAFAGTAHAVDAVDVPLTPTQEYRLGSAEQMIKRVTERFASSLGVCKQAADWMPRLSEQCTAAVVAAYPIVGLIRTVASSGDEAQWVKIVYVVHTLEDNLNTAGQR